MVLAQERATRSKGQRRKLKQTNKQKPHRPYICGILVHERSVIITCQTIINDAGTTVYPKVKKRLFTFSISFGVRPYNFLKNIQNIFIVLHFIYIKCI